MKLNIKDKLNSKNMSRYELAKRIGVTYPTITAIYNGESTSIKLEILEALCRELDCTPNEIVLPEDRNIEINIELNKVFSELFPIISEMLDSQTDTGHIVQVPSDKADKFRILIKQYNALNKALSANSINKDDTKL